MEAKGTAFKTFVIGVAADSSGVGSGAFTTEYIFKLVAVKDIAESLDTLVRRLRGASEGFSGELALTVGG